MKFTVVTQHLMIAKKDFAIIRIDLDLSDPREANFSKYAGNLDTYYTTLEWDKEISREGKFRTYNALTYASKTIESAIELREFGLSLAANMQ